MDARSFKFFIKRTRNSDYCIVGISKTDGSSINFTLDYLTISFLFLKEVIIEKGYYFYTLRNKYTFITVFFR